MSQRAYIPTAGVHSIEGEPFSYEVESRTDSKVRYRVELDGYNWNGACGCAAFEHRCKPQLEKGAQPSTALQCYHTDRARFFYHVNLGPELAKAFYGERKK